MTAPLRFFSGRSWRAFGVAIFLAARWSASLLAADSAASSGLANLSLEQLQEIEIPWVYGASKYEQKVTRAPSSITLLDDNDIRQFGFSTLSEALRSVRGIEVSYDRNYSYLGIRGFQRPGDYNTRVLVLLDGHRMNDDIYDNILFDHASTIDLDLIERVEVIRGPSSSVYGSNAFFGVINLITRPGASINGSEVSLELGSASGKKARYTVGQALGKDTDLLLSATWYESDGRHSLYFPEFDERISDDPRARNHGLAIDSDGERAQQLFGKLQLRKLTVSAFLSTNKKDVPTASFASVFNSQNQYTRDQRGYVDVSYASEVDSTLDVSARAYFDGLNYFGNYPSDRSTSPADHLLVDNRDVTYGRWVGSELFFTKHVNGKHTFVFGTEFRYNLKQDEFNYDDALPRSFLVNDARSSRVVGIYAQADLALTKDLTLNAGLRLDDYVGGFGSTLNPRVALIYGLNPEQTFKLLYGTAFRAPNAYENGYLGTPNELNPEHIQTLEFISETYLSNKYKLTFSGYRYQVRDLIDIASAGAATGLATNIGRAQANGAEFEIEARLNPQLTLKASYTLQRARDGWSGVELTNSPRNLFKANASTAWLFGIQTGLDFQYYGSVRMLSGQRAPDFCLTNLTFLEKRLARNLQVGLSVDNLFDTHYGYPGTGDHLQALIPQDGRTFRAKLQLKY